MVLSQALGYHDRAHVCADLGQPYAIAGDMESARQLVPPGIQLEEEDLWIVLDVVPQGGESARLLLTKPHQMGRIVEEAELKQVQRRASHQRCHLAECFPKLG